MKKVIKGVLILMFVFSTLFCPSVYAAETTSVRLVSEEDGVVVKMSEISKNTVSTMKISFELKAEKGSFTQPVFVFDDKITSKVKEYRYNQEKNRMTIYLSGTAELFQEKELVLGKIKVTADNNTELTVSLVEDSFAYVADGRQYSQSLGQSKTTWSNEIVTQETTSETVKETTTQETTGETVKETTTQETTGETVKETTTQETTGETVKETTTQETTGETVKETTTQETTGETAKESTASETTKKKTEQAAGIAGTGDHANIAAYMAGLVGAAIVLAVVYCIKKRHGEVKN